MVNTVTFNQLPTGIPLTTDPIPFWSVGAGQSKQTNALALIQAIGIPVVFATIAALQANTGAFGAGIVDGYRAAQDGGGGIFFRVAGSSASDNGGTIIVDAGGNRWFRLYDGDIESAWWGTWGDGTHDDTTPLQTALTFSFTSGIDLYTQAGNYKTTASLTLPNFTSPAAKQGWWWHGAGPGDGGAGPTTGGTKIVLAGSGFTSIFQMGSAAWRRCKVSDITFQCSTLRGATYGIVFNSTEFSAPTLERVKIGPTGAGPVVGPSICIGVLVGTGGNGEFGLVTDCDLFGDKIFYSTAGQGFQWRFEHTRYGVYSGGRCFELSFAGGGGLVVMDCNGTMTQTSGVSNVCVFYDNTNSSTVKFIGGRLEFVTQLYFTPGGTASVGGLVEFDSVEFGIDFNPTNGALALNAPVDVGFTGGMTLFNNCLFFAAVNTCTFPVKCAGGSGNMAITFRDSKFSGFSAPPYLKNMTTGVNFHVKFENCRTTFSGLNTGSVLSKLTAFDREFLGGDFQPGARAVNGDSSFTPAGTPEQQITNPGVVTAFGNAVTPLAPWVLTGVANMAVNSWNQATSGKNPAPSARIIRIGNGGIFSQTLGLDLSTAGVCKFNFAGTNFAYITWSISVHKIGTSDNNGNTCRFSIVDSVSGVIYDRAEFSAGAVVLNPVEVVLSAAIPQQGSASFPIIKIENTGVGTTEIYLDKWYVSTNYKSTFAPGETVITYGQEWSSSQDSLIVHSRFALPYKADIYGSTATTPLTNLLSDEYVSSTDGFRTRWMPLAAGGTGAWGKDPSSFIAAAAPITGTYNLGDIVWNSAPTSGGFIGWVCTLAGAPGTWKTWGPIS